MLTQKNCIRYASALFSGVCTAASIIASLLSDTAWSRFWWTLGSCSGVLTTYHFIMAARMADPTNFVLQHTDWIFAPDDPRAYRQMPYISIPRSKHKRGRRPRVEFQQVDPIYPVPNFPLTLDEDVNITITRPVTSSMPPYPTFAVSVHRQ